MKKKKSEKSFMLLVKVKGKRSNNWFGVEGRHITFILRVSLLIVPMELEGI
jgi:hypothetical protein